MQWTKEKTHVSHFMWCKIFDFATEQTYDTSWIGQSPFFTEVEGFTVNGFSKNQCRTLTSAEWQYLFSYGDYDNEARRGKYKYGITVCGNSNCVVLLPDNWTGGTIESSYDYVGWKHLEAAGAVCLPAAGYRDGNTDFPIILLAGINGHYWSASQDGNINAFYLDFDSSNVNPSHSKDRSQAYAVRLVIDVTE